MRPKCIHQSNVSIDTSEGFPLLKTFQSEVIVICPGVSSYLHLGLRGLCYNPDIWCFVNITTICIKNCPIELPEIFGVPVPRFLAKPGSAWDGAPKSSFVDVRASSGGWFSPKTYTTSCWFQPIWKMLVKLDHFPRDPGEHKKYLKPAPRPLFRPPECLKTSYLFRSLFLGPCKFFYRGLVNLVATGNHILLGSPCSCWSCKVSPGADRYKWTNGTYGGPMNGLKNQWAWHHFHSIYIYIYIYPRCSMM